jgi:hypothetical protein
MNKEIINKRICMKKSMLMGVLPLLLIICTLLHVCTKEFTEPALNVAPRFRMHFTDTAVVAKNLLILALQANDENNDQLVFRGLDVPAGAALDSVTGLFSWKPDSAMAGKKDTLLFEATDGELSDSLQIRISVKSFQISKKRYTVPADFPTIQLAINAANHGDTILVMPGKYENITYKGKALVIASRYLFSKNEADIAGTIIKRQGDTATTSLVDMSRCPDSLAPVVLMGFTLRYGYTKYGGAISVSSCSPEISHCIIDSNYAVGST